MPFSQHSAFTSAEFILLMSQRVVFFGIVRLTAGKLPARTAPKEGGELVHTKNSIRKAKNKVVNNQMQCPSFFFQLFRSLRADVVMPPMPDVLASCRRSRSQSLRWWLRACYPFGMKQVLEIARIRTPSRSALRSNVKCSHAGRSKQRINSGEHRAR